MRYFAVSSFFTSERYYTLQYCGADRDSSKVAEGDEKASTVHNARGCACIRSFDYNRTDPFAQFCFDDASAFFCATPLRPKQVPRDLACFRLLWRFLSVTCCGVPYEQSSPAAQLGAQCCTNVRERQSPSLGETP